MPTRLDPATDPAQQTDGQLPDIRPPGLVDRRLLASWSPAELAIKAQTGDARASEELYRRVRARARRAACAFCRADDADDAVAEGLSTAWRRLGQLRDPAAVEAWMVRCVVRSAIDLSRQRQRHWPMGAGDELPDRWNPTVESAADQAMSALERAAMAEAVREMDPGLRLVLRLRYESGLPVEHIARVLGRPAGTVRRQCVEARRLAGQRFLYHHLRRPAPRCRQATDYLCQEPYRRPAHRARRQASDHLRRCPACRERQSELAALLGELGMRRPPHPSS